MIALSFRFSTISCIFPRYRDQEFLLFRTNRLNYDLCYITYSLVLVIQSLVCFLYPSVPWPDILASIDSSPHQLLIKQKNTTSPDRNQRIDHLVPTQLFTLSHPTTYSVPTTTTPIRTRSKYTFILSGLQNVLLELSLLISNSFWHLPKLPYPRILPKLQPPQISSRRIPPDCPPIRHFPGWHGLAWTPHWPWANLETRLERLTTTREAKRGGRQSDNSTTAISFYIYQLVYSRQDDTPFDHELHSQHLRSICINLISSISVCTTRISSLHKQRTNTPPNSRLSSGTDAQLQLELFAIFCFFRYSIE